MNKALLLIDIQNDYFPGGAWELSHVDEAAAQARLALERFREQHRPVFHVRHINTRPGAAFFLPDTPGSEIHTARSSRWTASPSSSNTRRTLFSKRISTTPSAGRACGNSSSAE